MSQRPLAHAGLQVRLVAFVSILLFAMVAALIVTDAENLSRTARGYMTDRATSTISLLGESMVEPLDNLSVGRLRRLASDTRRDPDVRYVYVLDHEGRVLTDGTVDNPHRHAILTDPTSQAAAASATTLVEWTDGLLSLIHI